jgi:hypothetical protein
MRTFLSMYEEMKNGHNKSYSNQECYKGNFHIYGIFL